MPNQDELRKAFISSDDTFQKLIKWGWCDGLGRSLDWKYWQKYYAVRKQYAKTNFANSGPAGFQNQSPSGRSGRRVPRVQ